MPETPDRTENTEAELGRSRGAWALLKTLLAIESVIGAVLVWNTLSTVLGETAAPLGMRVSVIAAAVIGWAWIVISAIGALRGEQGWARGSALTIHVLMFAAAVGILQGILGTPLTGSVLLIVALLGFIAAILARPAAGAPEIADGDPAAAAD